MSTEKFASADYTHGQTNAMIKKLISQGGPGGPMKFLRGEISVSEPERKWKERDGVIYFSLTSNGKTGPEWITYLEGKGFRLSSEAKFLLNSKDFIPTNGITYEVEVLKGMLWNDNERTTEKIRGEAANRTLLDPNSELACLIRDAFSDEELKEMGLRWIVVFHKPIKDSDAGPCLLGADRCVDGQWLYAYCDNPGDKWYRQSGAAFVRSQVNTLDSGIVS